MADIKKFIAGFKRFQENYFGGGQELFGQLKQGQSPSAMVIACSDSRVDPALLMDCEPGDQFVVRNVGAWCRLTKPVAVCTGSVLRWNLVSA